MRGCVVAWVICRRFDILWRGILVCMGNMIVGMTGGICFNRSMGFVVVLGLESGRSVVSSFWLICWILIGQV